MSRKIIAVDIGASGGKMALAEYNGQKLDIRKYQDFVNRPADIGTALYWDVFALFHSILDGLSSFHSDYGEIATAGIDTWGASYGLLDAEGRLLEPVYHYRDRRTASVMERMKEIMSPRDLFLLTGCQCNQTYTLPQLCSYRMNGSRILELADKMLFLPDLIGYFLTGNTSTEMTIAGTSCLLDHTQTRWSHEVAEAFQIPEKIYTGIEEPGTLKGTFTRRISEETGCSGTQLLAAVGHDSAAAVAAIPDFGENHLYVSVGTAISMGVERPESLVTEEAFQAGLKNTGGIGRRNIIYRDFYACWHMNEFLRCRREQGVHWTYPEITALAKSYQGEVSVFDVESPEFMEAGTDFITNMNQYFLRTGQKTMDSDAGLFRSILVSIAKKVKYYADAFRKAGICFDSVDIINGGTRNTLLMQEISNELKMPVRAGMPYASIAGNLLSQLYGAGELKSIEEVRTLSAESFEMITYEPQMP